MKSGPGLDASGNKINETRLTYSDDNFLGKKLPDLSSLQWFQGEDEAQAALSSPKVKVVLFWATYAKGDWLSIQQFQLLSQKYPDDVEFLGISCDPSYDKAEEILVCDGRDFTDINLYVRILKARARLH